MADLTLTEEQKKFLEECVAESKDRYTEKDVEFMKIKDMGEIKPPIMDDWNNRPHRDWSRQYRGNGRRNNSWERQKQDHRGRHSDNHYQQRYRPY